MLPEVGVGSATSRRVGAKAQRGDGVEEGGVWRLTEFFGVLRCAQDNGKNNRNCKSHLNSNRNRNSDRNSNLNRNLKRNRVSAAVHA
jgi:hypothetical protein